MQDLLRSIVSTLSVRFGIFRTLLLLNGETKIRVDVDQIGVKGVYQNLRWSAWDSSLTAPSLAGICCSDD